MDKITQKRIADLEECLAGMMVSGAMNGMFLSDDMKRWAVSVLKGKQLTPAQVWNSLFGK